MLIPIFELFYEQKNITKDVSSYVTSIEYTDAEHGESDELQITFEYSEKLWQGSFLPKNPHFADYLIELALGSKPEPLDDSIENLSLVNKKY